MSKRYSRRLSPLERYSLVINDVYRYHVDAFLEGVGSVDIAALQSAVDRAAEANPAVRVRLRGALGWCRWVDSRVAPKVRLMPVSDWDGNSEQGAAFLNERLDPLRGGPVADILVVPCSDGLTRLVFRAVHAAVDGRGLCLWAMEVFRAMRGEPLQGSNSTLTDLDVQEQYKDRIVETPKAPPAACIPVVPPAESESARYPARYIWRRVTIHRCVSQLLPKTAAFLAAYARRQQSGEVGFTIPIDYRALRTAEIGIGNLIGYLRLTVGDGDGARALMQQLNQGIRDFHDCRSLPGARLLRWIPIWYMARQLRALVGKVLYEVNEALPTGGLVSMGTMRLSDYSFPSFQCKTISGIPGAVGKLNVLFLTYPGFTTVTFSAPAAYNDCGQLDALTRAYQQHFSNIGPSR